LLERGKSFLELNRWDDAVSDYTQVIEHSPSWVEAYCERGLAHKSKGNYQQALVDYTQAVEQDPEFADARLRLAWLLSTCPDSSIREGARGVEIAKRSCDLTEWTDADHLDVLAAACAEAGDFDAACNAANRALEHVVEIDRQEFEGRLHLYRQHKPYRDKQLVS
jgi:tetratricopeptide (TPR) repeat protein